MNDLQAVRAMRADAPESSPDRLAAGRERLCAAIASSPVASPVSSPVSRPASRAGSRAFPARRPALVAGGLTLVAAVAAAGVVVGLPDAGGGAAPRPPAYQLSAATVMLNKAATAVEGRPQRAFGPKQWLYYKAFDYRHGTALTTSETWETFDGMKDADVLTGKLVVWTHSRTGPQDGTPLGAYRLLASLPTDPDAMIDALYELAGSPPEDGGLSRDEFAFRSIEQFVWNSLAGAPPRVQAALYRALGRLPGVEVRPAVEYAPGRTAIGVFPSPTHALLLDPVTYRMIGWVDVSDGKVPPGHKSKPGTAKPPAANPAKDPRNSPPLPAGTVISSFTRSEVVPVAAPGRRPK
ncbi:CU044_5270 family protein [Planotetraspora kaengkrachanensis]|uniref:CU044_5270 family protein n=1 Tax=Planotetraspora kaengkrachanensis TaxID=575193 RepID=A0A8J3LXL8_9ACTN|nr:CU044_5270 family protein [Planotetraspora kaengkrachanensis]GIG80422.1 hypothetical protein Pka01_35490 [Planotetraspora kaengkrachanensis]